MEWPFYSYGLSDARWNGYGRGEGIAPEVWLINWNDGCLGVLVAMAAVYHNTHGGGRAGRCGGSTGARADSSGGDGASSNASLIVLVLIVLFRDATLWRETVEVSDLITRHTSHP